MAKAAARDRDDEPTQLVRHQAPDFVVQAVEDGDDSVAVLEKKQVLPKAIVVQGLSKPDLLVHGLGSVIVSSTKILGQNESMNVVPVFFFDEYVVERDRRDKSGSSIMARTFDDSSEIALRSANADRRWEVMEGGPKENPFRCRYVQRLCFACVIYGDNEFAGQPIILTFAKGDIMDGTNWQGAILMRKIGGQRAPLWSQVWKIGCVEKLNKGGDKWWGLRHGVVDDGQIWVTNDEGPGFRKLYTDLRDAHKRNMLAVEEVDEPDTDSAPADGEGKF